MVLECSECKHKCGLPIVLAFHYSMLHEDKISKCACGDKTLKGICMKTNCSFNRRNGNSVNPNLNPNSNSNPNHNANPNPISISNPNSNPNPNPNPNSNSNPYPSVVLNSLKPQTDFDESNYTCRNCTSAKNNGLFCPSIVRFDGMRAHIKKQQPQVDLLSGFSNNSNERYVKTKTGDICSCKYYNFVSFLINNGINIEKVEENINLLRKLDNFN